MWKEIPCTKGAYAACDEGIIKSNDRVGADGRILKGKILKPWLGNHGYLMVCLVVEGKKYRKTVHSLIADTFIDKGTSGLEIDDGNKLNNASNNLKWITRKENLHRAENLGLIIPSARQMETRRNIALISREIHKKAISQYTLTGEFIKSYEALTDVKKENGYEIVAVIRAAYGKQKTSYGYIWKWDKESVTTIPKGSSRTGENPAAKSENRKV